MNLPLYATDRYQTTFEKERGREKELSSFSQIGQDCLSV